MINLAWIYILQMIVSVRYLPELGMVYTGGNQTRYIYKRAYGVDFMLYNNSAVEYTVKFMDMNKLQLNHFFSGEVTTESILLDKSK